MCPSLTFQNKAWAFTSKDPVSLAPKVILVNGVKIASHKKLACLKAVYPSQSFQSKAWDFASRDALS